RALRNQEIADDLADLARMRLQREVTGIEEADDGGWHVALERLRARRQEERIVPAPHGEERWFEVSEIVLEFRIERDVALVVAEQVELHVMRTRPLQVVIVEVLSVRRNHAGVRDAVRILPARRFRREEGAQRVAVGL